MPLKLGMGSSVLCNCFSFRGFKNAVGGRKRARSTPQAMAKVVLLRGIVAPSGIRISLRIS